MRHSLLADTRSIVLAPRRTKGELERLSAKRLRTLLAQAKEVPFYRETMRDAGLEADARLTARETFDMLSSLPTVCKADLQDAGTAAYKGGQIDPAWHSTISSGSTGEPLRVYYDSRAWVLLKYLIKYRARALCGLRPHHKVALLDTIPLEHEGRTPLERAGRLVRVSVFRPIEEVAERLRSFLPDVLYGFPSTLQELAIVDDSETPAIRPRIIFTSGEFISRRTNNRLRQAYACPVYDVYGCSETKEIAWECRRGSLHVNVDVVWVEVLHEDGTPAQAGIEGEFVVTLLINEAMPLIRYRTGDRGIMVKEACQCGISFPKLGVLTGRETDALNLGDGRRVSPYAVTCALENVTGLRRYQVTQTDRTTLRVRAITAASVDNEAATHGIVAELRSAISGPLTVTVDFVDRLPTATDTKFRVVKPLCD